MKTITTTLTLPNADFLKLQLHFYQFILDNKKIVIAFCVVKCVRFNDLKWKKGEAFDVQIKVLKSVMQSRDDCKMSKKHSYTVI